MRDADHGFARANGLFIALGGAIVLMFALACPVRVFAADDAIAPVEKYSQQIDQLKNAFSDLSKKIDDGTKLIDGLTDVQQARAEIEQLRTAVSGLLAAVADNGEVAKLGARAQQRVDEKLKELEVDTRFQSDERKFLIDQWRRLQSQTRDASQELGDARKEFAELLQQLQTNEDFIDELIEVRQAKRAIDVLRHLTSEIRDASGKLKALMGGIKAPSA
jgi:chromosome segregation ATPase